MDKMQTIPLTYFLQNPNEGSTPPQSLDFEDIKNAPKSRYATKNTVIKLLDRAKEFEGQWIMAVWPTTEAELRRTGREINRKAVLDDNNYIYPILKDYDVETVVQDHRIFIKLSKRTKPIKKETKTAKPMDVDQTLSFVLKSLDDIYARLNKLEVNSKTLF